MGKSMPADEGVERETMNARSRRDEDVDASRREIVERRRIATGEQRHSPSSAMAGAREARSAS